MKQLNKEAQKIQRVLLETLAGESGINTFEIQVDPAEVQLLRDAGPFSSPAVTARGRRSPLAILEAAECKFGLSLPGLKILAAPVAQTLSAVTGASSIATRLLSMCPTAPTIGLSPDDYRYHFDQSDPRQHESRLLRVILALDGEGTEWRPRANVAVRSGFGKPVDRTSTAYRIKSPCGVVLCGGSLSNRVEHRAPPLLAKRIVMYLTAVW